MNPFPEDIFTEPENVDPDTLANLGPLRRLAGVWQSSKGVDLAPKAPGPERREYIERIEMEPTDPQANGPQLFYGLRYHIHINTEEEAITFHDQIGYWLWEPATGTVIQTLTIPRAQVAMAVGKAAADAKSFELVAARGVETYGICSTPFLEYAFKTVEYRIKVTINSDGTWSYDEDTVLMIKGKPEPFHHTDRNTLTRIAEPKPNPLAQKPDG
jgi:hypothetical protein